MADDRCRKIVVTYDGLARYEARCKRAPKRDGYCSQHHPSAVAARRAKGRAAYEAEWAARELDLKIDAAERRVLDAVLAADKAGHQWSETSVAPAVGVLRGLLFKRGDE